MVKIDEALDEMVVEQHESTLAANITKHDKTKHSVSVQTLYILYLVSNVSEFCLSLLSIRTYVHGRSALNQSLWIELRDQWSSY